MNHVLRRWLAVTVLMGLVSVGYAQDPFGVETALVGREGRVVLQVSYSVPADHYLYEHALRVESEDAELTLLSRPDAKKTDDPVTGELVEVFKADFTSEYSVAGWHGDELEVDLAYMGCNQEICFLPQRRTDRLAREAVKEISGDEAPEVDGEAVAEDATVFDGLAIRGSAAGFMSVDDFLAFLEETESGEQKSGRLEAIVSGRGIWIGLIAILIGGLALNLTPCVLPMIPVNLAIIGAGAAAGSKSRGFWLGSVYGLGIALVYGVLGLVVVLTGAQFGTLNASPWFNIGIAVLFAVLGLAMFDVFHIDFSKYQAKLGAGKNRGPFLTAFIFGGVAALLAGACVAPVVISVLVIATNFYQAGNQAALLLPFVLGLGMALPWPFAGGGMSFLPKPGRWMNRIKIGFGVIIMVAAAYYGYLGVKLIPRDVSDAVVAAKGDAFWLHDPAEAVALAEETGRLLFVDFWATWCKNCIAMDRTTFQDESVREALGDYVRLKYQAENPADPATKRVLDQLGVKGLPSYVILE